MSYKIHVDGKEVEISEEKLMEQLAKRPRPSSNYEPVMSSAFDVEESYKGMLTKIGYYMFLPLEELKKIHYKFLNVQYEIDIEKNNRFFPIFSPLTDWQKYRKELEDQGNEYVEEFDENCAAYKNYINEISYNRALDRLDDRAKNFIMESATNKVNDLREQAEDNAEIYRNFTKKSCNVMIDKYEEKLKKQQAIVNNYKYILEELYAELESSPQEDTENLIDNYFFCFEMATNRRDSIRSYLEEIKGLIETAN